MELPPGPRLPPPLQTLAWIRRPGPFLDECARRYGRRFTLATVLSRVDLRLAGPPTFRARRKGIVLAPVHGTPVVASPRGPGS